jgi:hypothetical protein
MQGLDHVIFVAAVERKLLFRIYAIRLKRSGTSVRALLRPVCSVTLSAHTQWEVLPLGKGVK